MIMTDTPKSYDELVSDLQQLRDELRLQIHLGSKEAQDEYEKLEQKWDELMQEGQPLAEAVSDTAKNVGAAVDLAASELKQGYEKILDLLK
jgi:ElaB/YqjD/DUF883 family membrane-anchored ribosome-binding protein